MTNETRQRLLDALESCRAIRCYTDGVDFAAYLRNDMLRDAVERRLGIIGEALNRAQASDPARAGQIRELRRISGKSQQHFGTELNISIRALQQYEGGKTPEPRQLIAFGCYAHRVGLHDIAALMSRTVASRK